MSIKMTQRLQRMQLLMDELGPTTSEVVLVEQLSPGTWLVALDGDDTTISIRLDEQTGIVTLSCEVGRPQEATRYRIYESMLTYNGLSDLHGGIRMALQAPDGMVLQQFDIQCESLHLEQWSQLIRDFSLKASAWEEIIESAEPFDLEEPLEGPLWEATLV
jgi:ABC-type uncharacterized transport system permease subunit